VAEAVTPADPAAPVVADPPGATASEEAPGPPSLTREPEKDYRRTFRVAYLALGALVVGALAAFVVLVAKPGPAPEAAWSAWQPAGETEDDRAAEIAGRVGSAYRLPTGSQLVSVQASPLVVQDLPVSFIAIQSAPDGTLYTEENIPVFADAPEKTVAYLLCGLGENCAIEEGEPSTERQRLLRREALELALYTFRYLEDKDYVVAFMPPRPGDDPAYALFFQRSELDPLLDEPLRSTLPQEPPPLPEEISELEIGVIDALTNPRLFAFRFSQLQDGRAFLVLSDPARMAEAEQPDETAPPEETQPADTGTATGTQ
jgi:hypothetical protein